MSFTDEGLTKASQKCLLFCSLAKALRIERHMKINKFHTHVGTLCRNPATIDLAFKTVFGIIFKHVEPAFPQDHRAVWHLLSHRNISYFYNLSFHILFCYDSVLSYEKTYSCAKMHLPGSGSSVQRLSYTEFGKTASLG